MPVWTIGKHLRTDKLTPQNRPFGRTRRAKPSAFTRIRQQIFVLTGRTADACKPVFQDSAIQIFSHHTGNDRAPLAVVFFKAQIVFTDKPLEMMKQHGIIRSFLGAPLPINLFLFLGTLPPHEQQQVSRIAPRIEKLSLASREEADSRASNR